MKVEINTIQKSEKVPSIEGKVAAPDKKHHPSRFLTFSNIYKLAYTCHGEFPLFLLYWGSDGKIITLPGQDKLTTSFSRGFKSGMISFSNYH